MKPKRMLRYFINTLFLGFLFLGTAFAQEKKADSIVKSERYGLRVGVDLSRIARGFLNEDYSGLEIVADYRYSQKLYFAAEFGNEKYSQQETLGSEVNNTQIVLYNYTTSGTYYKLGIDNNVYTNWLGMSNMIHIGARFAYSTLSQTVNNYKIYDSDRTWSPTDFVPATANIGKIDGLNAMWLEFVFGAKAELFPNLYAGVSVRMGYLINDKQGENFPNLWIPGFNKVTDDSKFGVGFNYTLTYLLPFYKKTKKKKEAKPEE